VPEAEIRELGTTGEVECAAVNAVFPVTISEKSVAANTVTHTYEVVAHITGGTDVLMTGMVAKVQVWNTDRSRDDLRPQNTDIVIPAKCILLTPKGHTVWVAENGTAVRREIVIDGYQADGVRVKSGLQAGDTLITEGYQKLYKGCAVTEN
jgi:multidrug efflux pump subunit AcrA (membrane-fusion protein)